MKTCITFGNWNNNYFYILASVLCRVLYDIINGYGYPYYSIQLSDKKFEGHIYIHQLFYYLLILICSFFFLLYEIKRDNKSIEDANERNSGGIELIQNIDYNDEFSKISASFVYWILFLHVVSEFIYQIACQYFSFGDYWMVELLIMAYLYRKIFHLKTYKHQQLSLYLISIPIILKTATIALLYCDENNHFKNGEINYKYKDNDSLLKSLFVAHWWLFPIAFILYFLTMVIDTYTIIYIKKFIDVKYIYQFQKY